MQALRDAEVRPLLSKVSAKTLVLYRRGDQAVLVEAGRYLAGRIAGARFVEVEDHWFWVGEQG
ncbi:alpha/beta fold hydrolase, partial [Mesorhizobium carmichaelinearum]|uniref:alpha/beta fold hydrolase n=1 Tax=Mesorhizobium carmichaelinearum TaxID=1208188 RepID=UPI0034E0830A